MGEDIVDRLRIAETAPLDADGKVALFLLLQDARAEITRLHEERRWVPVEERLPDPSRVVLVFSTSNGIHRASLDSLGQQWLDEDDNPGKKITHWQPLPAPPGEGEVE